MIKCLFLSLVLIHSFAFASKAEGHSHSYQENKLSDRDFAFRLRYLSRIFGRTAEGSVSQSKSGGGVDGPLEATYKWTKSGTVAQYAGIEQTDVIAVEVPINLIFIGFKSDGNHALNLSMEVLRPYFEHIEHEHPHSFVPMHKEMGADHHHKVHIHTDSRVHYSYTYNVIEVSPAVTTVLERYLKRHLRPIDPASSTPSAYHVESRWMERLFASLIEYMDLRAYTLIIASPKLVTPGQQRYGYRLGFSDPEISQLRGNYHVANAVQRHANRVAADKPKPKFVLPPERDAPPANFTQDRIDWLPKLRKPKKDPKEAVQKVDMGWLSKVWAEAFAEGDRLGSLTAEVNLPARTYDSIALEMADNDDSDMAEYMESVINDPDLREDCLVDLWISSKHFAWIDLTAGPFEWGPVVGGEGVRTAASIPRVSASLVDTNARLLRESHELLDHQRKQPLTPKEMQAEREVLLIFAERFCSQGSNVSVCDEIRDRIAAVTSQIEGKSRRTEARRQGAGALDFLANVHRDTEAANLPETMSVFLGRLGALVSSFIRHAVTPSTPALYFPYSERVLFHIYVIANHQSFEPIDHSGFDLDEFKAQMASLRLPHQHFVYAVHRVRMADDPALAMAYTSSIRTAVIPTLNIHGEFDVSKRLFLDSLILQDHLKALSGRANKGGAEAVGGHEADQQSSEVMVFLFSLDSPLPVLVDKYYQSRALVDMVIAVQSDHRLWDSGYACDTKPIYWNLKKPVRSTIASVLQHMNGQLAVQWTYSSAHGRISQEWTWSVGSAVTACTSSSRSLSGIQRDAAWRSYIVSALHRSAEQLNHAVALLSSPDAITTPTNFEALPSLPIANISAAFFQLRSHWARIVDATEILDFDTAVYHLAPLLEESKKVLELSKEALALLTPFRCAALLTPAPRPSSLGLLLPLLLVVSLALLGACCALLRPRSNKAKIN